MSWNELGDEWCGTGDEMNILGRGKELAYVLRIWSLT
jgi:hypothetical protein